MATMYTNLWEAVSAATQGQVSQSMALDGVINAYQAGGTAAVKTFAENYGVQFTYATKEMQSYGLAHWYTISSMPPVGGPAGETFLYPAVVENSVNVAQNELIAETVKTTTTTAGKTFLKGAVKTATQALPLVGAVATGIGLGWESYKEHPDFWTDLSESIFDTNNPECPIEVLARAHSGGYTTAVKEEQVATILQKMAEQGCFDYKEYESTVEAEGLQDVTWSAVGAAGEVSALAINKAAELYPSLDVIMAEEVHVSDTITQGYVYVADRSLLPEQLYVSKTGDDYSGTVGCYFVSAQYDSSTGTVTYNDRGYGNYSIWSGVHDNGPVHSIGGLSVNIIEYEADNELFTNDHTGVALSLPNNPTLPQVVQALRDQFPEWYDQSYMIDNYDPESGTIKSDRYYPVTIPWWDPVLNTDKDPNFDASTAQSGDVLPETDPRAQQQQQTLTSNNEQYDDPGITPPPDPSPSDPGAGAGDTSDNLWCVYNPVMQELNDLGGYLWSSNIIDILQKFLQNPMDAIISLHKIYCTPETQGRKNIILGYLDSGVESDVVVSQFVTINCGSVVVDEYFNDARDYDEPYTIIEAYLPFVGIVRWKTADIVGGTVQVVYTIDVYSGACLCKVFVTKLGAKIQLYTYSGNCSMQIPLTGSDRTRLLSGAVTGAASGAVVGGAIGAVAGAVAGAWKGGTSIDRTGSFSANAGCMGIKKPYIIITRKYSYDAGYYNTFYGFPSNNTLQLSACHGYTRVKSVHIETIPIATSDEKQQIETLLKQGVIIR